MSSSLRQIKYFFYQISRWIIWNFKDIFFLQEKNWVRFFGYVLMPLWIYYFIQKINIKSHDFFYPKGWVLFWLCSENRLLGGEKNCDFLINFLDELGNSKNIIFFLQEKILVLFLAMLISMTFRGGKNHNFIYQLSGWIKNF